MAILAPPSHAVFPARYSHSWTTNLTANSTIQDTVAMSKAVTMRRLPRQDISPPVAQLYA
ncbi:Uncharacterised protein [Mycobacteroides abscessus subsp. abscessus]|nr:Uncharacterised protein [Mycobacteroides abscessus subsp. abscessus]